MRMRETILRLSILFVCVGTSSIIPLMAEEHSALTSYQRARALLEAGLEALGGRSALEEAGTILIRMQGEITNRGQGLALEKAPTPEPVVATFAYDVKNDWFAREFNQSLSGGFDLHSRVVLKPDGGWGLSLLMKRVAAIPAENVDAWNNFYVGLPPYFLLKLARQAGTLQWVGSAEVEGRGQEVISASWNDTIYRLTFDAETKLLTRCQTLLPSVIHGDTVRNFVYPGYRSVDGIKVPTGLVLSLGDEPFFQLRTTEATLTVSDAEIFAEPDGFSRVEPTPFAMEKLAKGIFLVKGPRGFNGATGYYNNLVVDLGDALLLVDAPISSGYAAALIRQVREVFPKKPIKYLGLTHYHIDHTGGVRPFLGDGTAVITTEDAKPYITQIATAHYTLAPDGLNGTLKPEFEQVDEKRTIRGSKRTVEIYNVGATPHVDSMLVYYLPEAKLLFQGDLYSDIVPFNETMAYFAAWLEESGLDIERIAGTHSPTITPRELREAGMKAAGDARALD